MTHGAPGAHRRDGPASGEPPRRVPRAGRQTHQPTADAAHENGAHRPAEDREDALELALLLAEEDAAVHDYRQAQQAIDAAAALMGGVLPSGWAERHRRWEAALREREATVA